MKTLFLVIAWVFVLHTVSHGQGKGFDFRAREYMDQLKKEQTPLFYTGCKTSGGKAILVFGLSRKSGMLYEFRGDEVANSAVALLKTNSIELEIAETQGGVWTYTVLQHHAEDLQKLPFSMVFPKDIDKVLSSDPAQKCVDRPPRY